MFEKTRRRFAHWPMLALAILAALLICTPKAHALDFLDEKAEVHGYGHQGFLLTDGNRYQNSDSQGSFEYNSLALLFSVKATEDLTIWIQLFGNLNDFRMDWAFVDYKFNNNFQLHAGQIKTPIGIYNEIRDIKYLQLSTLEPLIYQEDLKFTHEAFRGASLLANEDLAGGNLALEIYGGQQVNFEKESALEFNHLVGGKITYKTPLEGLSLMGSGYTSRAEDTENGVATTGRNNLWMGSVDYRAHDVDLKAEFAASKLFDRKGYGYYVQGGYTLFDKVTPFVRYDYLTSDKEQKSDPAFYQKDFTFGVGYKFNSFLAAKIEDHIVRGYALPVVTGEIGAGRGDTNWNLFAASLNFIF